MHFAYFTGARSGEILALRRENLDFKGGFIKIVKNQTRFELTTPKNGKMRKIRLCKALAEFLKTQNLNGKIFSQDYFSLRYEFHKLCDFLGISRCGFHIFRHIFASFLLNGKISPGFVAQNLGHSNLDMINRVYGHFVPFRADFKQLEKVLEI